MKDYGHIMLATLPFAVIGLVSVLRNLHGSANRFVVISMLVSPSAAALAGTSITRALVFVVPASILTALGFEIVLKWILDLQKKKNRYFPNSKQTVIPIFVFVLLSGVNIGMLNDALRNGPTWYTDYGLGGMQYGGFQIFDIIQEYSLENPDTKIFLSPEWANGTDVLADFFIDSPLPIWVWSIHGHINEKLPLDDSMVFVIPPDEYKLVFENPKFSNLRVEKIVPYPDGTPGFYFIRLQYSENIDEILAAASAARRVLQESYMTLAGDQVKLRYSKLDGEIQDKSIASIFDGDPLTFAKTAEANPFVVEITYPSPRVVNEFSIIIGSANVTISLTGYAYEGSQAVTYTFKGQGSISNPELAFDLPDPLTAQTLYIEVLDVNHKEPAFVHIWEIAFR